MLKLLAQLVQHLQQDCFVFAGLCEQLQIVTGLFDQTADCNVLRQGGLQVEYVTLHTLQIDIAFAGIDSFWNLW